MFPLFLHWLSSAAEDGGRRGGGRQLLELDVVRHIPVFLALDPLG
jgi:hypothetical protein